MALRLIPGKGYVDEPATGLYLIPGKWYVSVDAGTAISAALTEDITDESDIVVGGNTITLTLTGDTFVTGAVSEDGIAAGSDSNVAPTGTSWDSLIKGDLDNADVVLSVGDTVATITMPAYATYDITETETITWTIPAASLTLGGSPVVASPTFTVITTGVAVPIMMSNYLRMMGA